MIAGIKYMIKNLPKPLEVTTPSIFFAFGTRIMRPTTFFPTLLGIFTIAEMPCKNFSESLVQVEGEAQ